MSLFSFSFFFVFFHTRHFLVPFTDPSLGPCWFFSWRPVKSPTKRFFLPNKFYVETKRFNELLRSTHPSRPSPTRKKKKTPVRTCKYGGIRWKWARNASVDGSSSAIGQWDLLGSRTEKNSVTNQKTNPITPSLARTFLTDSAYFYRRGKNPIKPSRIEIFQHFTLWTLCFTMISSSSK